MVEELVLLGDDDVLDESKEFERTDCRTGVETGSGDLRFSGLLLACLAVGVEVRSSTGFVDGLSCASSPSKAFLALAFAFGVGVPHGSLKDLEGCLCCRERFFGAAKANNGLALATLAFVDLAALPLPLFA